MKKRHFLFLLLLGVAIVMPLVCFSQVATIRLSFTSQLDHNDESEFGHRIPPKPITATIDFAYGTISTSQSIEDVESYEIWDETQSVMLYAGDDEYEFVSALSQINQNVTIALVTHSYTHRGYLNSGSL